MAGRLSPRSRVLDWQHRRLTCPKTKGNLQAKMRAARLPQEGRATTNEAAGPKTQPHSTLPMRPRNSLATLSNRRSSSPGKELGGIAKPARLTEQTKDHERAAGISQRQMAEASVAPHPGTRAGGRLAGG